MASRFGLPLPFTVCTNMLMHTLFSPTGPAQLSEDCVRYLNTLFSAYPLDRAELRVIGVFRKSVSAEVLPKGKPPALAQWQNRPQKPGGRRDGPLPPFRPGALNSVRAAALSNSNSDADTYVEHDVLPVDVGLDLLSVQPSDFTQVGNHVTLMEERSMVGSLVLSSQL